MTLSPTTLWFMSVETLELFFAILAIAANVGTLAIAAAAIAGRGSALRSAVLGVVSGYELWLAALVAVTATAGSLYFSEVAHFVPCLLCWYQRIAMYPLAVVLPIAAARGDHGIGIYAAVIAAIGAVIAAYHRTIELFPNLDSGSCAAVGPPCTAPYFETFGFVSLSYMAASGFLLILALLWADRANSGSDAPSSPEHATTESS
jgi:disulfide bond formation protein DsbB